MIIKIMNISNEQIKPQGAQPCMCRYTVYYVICDDVLTER